MASGKKDKFKKAIKDHIDRGEGGESPGMQGFVRDMARSRHPEREADADLGDEAPADVAPAPAAPPSTAASELVVPAPAAGVESQAKPSEPEWPPAARPLETSVVPPPAPAPAAVQNLISRPPSPAETDAERGPAASNRSRPSMARTRDSIYNVSSDIRLEDYTESGSEGGGGLGAAIRIGAGLVLLVVLLYVAYALGSLFFAPDYTLAVSSTPITAANAEEFADTESVSTAAGADVYFHFQWEEGELETDYVKIQIDRMLAGGEQEEAILARRPPVTANYIQLAGPFEVGKYRVTVTDREGNELAGRVITVK